MRLRAIRRGPLPRRKMRRRCCAICVARLRRRDGLFSDRTRGRRAAVDDVLEVVLAGHQIVLGTTSVDPGSASSKASARIARRRTGILPANGESLTTRLTPARVDLHPRPGPTQLAKSRRRKPVGCEIRSRP